jgi:restriction system protein
MIPDFQTVMLPLLKLNSDNLPRKRAELTAEMAKVFNVSEEELGLKIKSGSFLFHGRVHWAVTYLKKAGLLYYPQRGLVQITPQGVDVLKSPPERITVNYLKTFDAFNNSTDSETLEEKSIRNSEITSSTPEETIDIAFANIQERLANEILDSVKKCSWAFMEQLVVDLVVAMGYGGSRSEAGKALKRAGDEGIDGIINEDILGLDVIYLQAKRWEANVGRPEIQKFVGALSGQRSKKGIFITTSEFTREAIEYARNIDFKIILIDGQRLANLMIEHGVGVSTAANYQIKKIDSDFFQE